MKSITTRSIFHLLRRHRTFKSQRRISTRGLFGHALPGFILASALIGGGSAQAGTPANVVSGQTDLTSGTTYSTTTVPTTANDVVFTNQSYSPSSFMLNSNLIFGSLNDLSTTSPITISNTGGTASTLTLNGSTNSTAGSAATDVLFVANGGTLNILNGTSALNLALGITGNFDIAGTANIASIISGAFGFNKTGAGTLTLSGANTYTGNTTVTGGTLNLTGSPAMTGGLFVRGGGTLNLSGTFGAGTAANNFIVGQGGGGSGVANIGPGVTISRLNMFVGDNGTAGGAVYQTGGTVTLTQGGGVDNLRIGSNGGGYGYYNLSGGNLNTNEVGVGASLGGTTGVLDISGGTLTDTGYLSVSRGSGTSSGVLNMTGGTATFGLVLALNVATSAAGAQGVVNIKNGTITGPNSATNGVNLSFGVTNVAGTMGELNLLSGGTLTTGIITAGAAAPTALLNFNGGTLKATTTNAGPGFLTSANIDGVYVYGGGGTIDNNGTAITVGRPLLAPTGNGINANPTVATAGAGYIGAPMVTITGGGGTGATAVATVSGGIVTGITITNPGVGYTSTPTFALTGGGATTAATITGAAPTANVSGGMTFQGSGTTTLSAANTYTGATTVSAGTLLLSGTGAINASSGITINGSGARFVQTSTTASTPAITLTQGALDGTGTVGAVTVAGNAANTVANGNGTAASLTMGPLAFSGAGTFSFVLAGGATTTGGIVDTGTFTTSNTVGAIKVNVTPLAALTLGNTYNLLSYTSTNALSSDFTYGNGISQRSSMLNVTPTALTLTITNGDTPKWTGLDNGNWNVGTTGPNHNWQLVTAGTPTDYIEGDAVLFDDSATGTTAINISAANVSPTSTTFANAAKTYTVSSTGGFGIVGTGPLALTGTGTVILDTVNAYVGATTIGTGATLQLGDGTTGNDGTLTGTSGVTDNGTLVYNRFGSTTAGYVISGTGMVTKSGAGTQVLTGVNTYTGGTTINGGVLQMTQTTSAAATGAFTLNGGNFQVNTPTSNFTYAPAITLTADSAFSNIGAGQINDTGAITGNNHALNVSTNSVAPFTPLYINGAVTGVSQFNVTAGAMGFDLNVVNPGGGAPVSVANGASLYFANATNPLTSNITLNGGTGQNGVGSLFQQGGATTPTLSGTLTLAADSSIGGTGTSGVILSGQITGAGSLTKLGANTYILTNASNYNGPTTTISAGALQLGNGGATGALPVGSAIVDNGTLIFNRSNAVAQGTDFGAAAITGTGGLTQVGTGTTTVTAAAYTGTTSVTGGTLNLTGSPTVTGGLFVRGGGTLNLSGTFGAGTAVNNFIVGQGGGGSGVANIGTGASISRLNMFVGDNGTAGGAVYQTGGTVTLTQAAGVDDLRIGSNTGGYGYYSLSGGNLNTNEVGVGASLAGTIGVLDITNGTFNDAGYVTIGRGSGSSGVMNVTGGAVNLAGTVANSKIVLDSGGATNLSVLNVGGGAGAATVTGPAAGTTYTLELNAAGVAGGLGETNLLANGTLQIAGVTAATAAGTAYLNFNGGTLKATVANPGFMTSANVDAVNVYSGGGTIDNNGVAVTISNALSAPVGFGVSGTPLPVTSGGAGYIGVPAVNLTGGTGTGATGYATIAGGVVTGIVVTSPGIGYTNGDTLTATFVGGGATTAAPNVTGIAVAANTSGGMTFTGAGTTTLTGANTYTGATTINTGTLQIGDGTTDGNIATSANIVDNSAFIYNRVGNAAYGNVISGTGTVTKTGAGTQTLSGANTYTGATTVSGGTLTLANTTGTAIVSNAITVDNTANTGATLTLAANNQIAQGGVAPTVTLMNNATLKFDTTVGMTGLTANLGTLNVDPSTIDFGANSGGTAPDGLSSTFSFANSNSGGNGTWAGQLNVVNYDYGQATFGQSGFDHLFFGTDATGLSTQQLSQISFVNPTGLAAGTYGATILSTGEIAPTPEPGSLIPILVGMAGLGVLVARKRRKTNAENCQNELAEAV